MLLGVYLRKYFVEKNTFTMLAGISIDRLDQLIADKAIPSATYTCDGDSIYSEIFGRTPISEPLTGEYFRPECVRWAHIANRAPFGSERSTVIAELTKELRGALERHCESEKIIESKIQGYLPYFFNGTFGLCIADPSNGASIARKEILQEKLVEITENGNLPSPAGISKEDLLKLIDDYAESAMPFSPAEYERSSRKRLVDDLRPVVDRA
ncbi:DUF6058 family natural product biosynthesis protein [Microbulbifer hainanensis]|uniref:DUF6058 family natural product biosynthesis protein n=1 Tax=Microbulbifer hainanensis TaxID=2735675 RepID=UPI001866C4D5|nr:DUF6058 family natural product biosynthesis protein [Microbulbifer hainanensis]